MLKHVLMFSLKEANKAANLQAMKEKLLSLKDKIPEIQAYEVGINSAPSPAAADLFLYSEFADEAALERYRVHPDHQAVVKFIQEICMERRVVDYFVSD